jgi:phospholipase C
MGRSRKWKLENLRRINHIVLLMLQNRSFDQVLGHLTHPEDGNNSTFDGFDRRGKESDQNP